MEQETLFFNFSIVDFQKIEPGQTEFTFFGENQSVGGTSVTSLSEHEIIDWIFSDSPTKQHFLSNVFPDAKDCQFSLRVSRQILEHGERPGDIDILLWSKERPERAVAIECKRVKVTSRESEPEKVNKLGELEKGVIQANQLSEHKFHKTYIAFFIVTDGRYKTINNTLFRHADSTKVQLVYDIPWNKELNQDVGIIFIQLTQPTPKDFRFNHAFGVCLRREATEIEQPAALTDKIRRMNSR